MHHTNSMRVCVFPFALLLAVFSVSSSAQQHAVPAVNSIADGSRDGPGQHVMQTNQDATQKRDSGAGNSNGDTNTANESDDDCESIVQSIQAAASQMSDQPRTIYLHGKNYRCRQANAQALLNRDFGDYLSMSSGSGAAVGLTITNGNVTSCAVSGGTGYNPNAFLPVQIIDYSHQGSGASTYVTTDHSGATNGCVVQTPGMNYPTFGVYTKVYAIGADGAKATIQLANGTFAAIGTVITGGNGYTSVPTIGIPVSSSSVQCSRYPTIRGTISAGQIKTITSTTGSGCTYKGEATATVPVCVGGCSDGAQATNVAPESPNTIGIAIPLRQGITIDCEGGTIEADYQTGTADLNQLAVLGDPWGDQGQGITIRNCNLGGFVDAWFAGSTQDILFDHDRFGAQPKHAVGNITKGNGSALGIFAPQMNQNTVVSNSVFLGNAGVLCGGVWSSRTGGSGGLGSLGGTDLSLKTTIAAGGSCSGLSMRDNSMYPGTNRQNPMFYASDFYPPVVTTPWNEYNAPLDTFAEQYLWKSQNSSATNLYAPNGSGQCQVTQKVSNRAIDWNFGDLVAKASGDPWFPCYRGVSDMALVALSRYGYPSVVNVTNLTNTGAARPIILGSFSNSEFSVIRLIAGRAYTDPYLPSEAKEEGVIVSQTSSSSNNRFGGIYSSGATASRFNQMLSVTTLNTADMTGSLWSGVTSIHGQPSFGMPILSVAGPLSGYYFDCSGSGTPKIIAMDGASAVITKGDNCGGTFTVTAGKSPVAGNIAQINFAIPAMNVAKLTCSVRANGASLFLGEGTTSITATGFTVLTKIAIPSGTTTFTYNCTY